MESTIYNSPIGDLYLTSNEGYLDSLKFKKEGINRCLPFTNFGEPMDNVLELVKKELDEYFDGKLYVFKTPFKLYGTLFRLKVWKALTKIPYGATSNYKELAVAMGQGNAQRAVGGANNKNPISIIVPCHRVIGASGKLVGYGGGLSSKEFLLKLEKAI